MFDLLRSPGTLATLAALLLPSSLPGITYHSGAIGTQTWTAVSGPHIINGNVTVNNGATLTIEAGSVVKFSGDYYLWVNGTLVANGNTSAHITFTKDQQPEARGAWGQVYFSDPDGASVLNYCDISHGGSSSAAVVTDGIIGDVTISHCTIDNSGTHGIAMYSRCSPVISNCTISDNDGFGIWSNHTSCAGDISGGSITNNANAAVRLSPTSVGLMDGTAISGNSPDEIQVLGGHVSSSATWGHTSPHIILGDVEVDNWVTLTLSPGVTWKFDGNYRLRVYGALIADGTPADHITFTSNSATPAAGDWKHVYLHNTSYPCVLDHCDIHYAGSSTGSMIIENYAEATVSNCDILHGASNGIYLDGHVSPNISDSTITNNGNHGIYVTSNSDPTVTGCTVSSNGSYGIYTNIVGCDVTVSDSTISGNSGPALRLSPDAVGSVSGTTITGNNPDEIQVIGGFISASATWDDGVPYRVLGNITVNNYRTLTLNPGSILKFDGDYYLKIEGTLTADGTPSDHITFTSSAATPSPGDWKYIYLYYPDGSNVLDYCDIQYGGSSFGAVFMEGLEEPAGVTFSNCTINHSGTTGMHLYRFSPQVNDCMISDNLGHGVYLSNNCYPQFRNTQIINNGGSGIYNNINANPDLGSNASEWNDIHGNAAYGLYNNTTLNLDARFVWWGSNDEAAIQAALFDDADDSAKGVVSYSPWMNGPLGLIDPDAPENLVISTAAGSVFLSWDAVPGASSYNIYSSDDPGATDWGPPVATGITETSWNQAIAHVRRFYYVTAVN